VSGNFERLLDQRRVLLADGAIGTNLFAMGLQSGAAPELWNLEHPDRVSALHRGFIEAGADLVLTNTFGANRYRLALHGATERVEEINRAAVAIAREAVAAAGRPMVVAGSMGPTGEIFAPLGSLAFEDGVAAFGEQAQALAAAGVDVLWAETLSSREELDAALAGAASTGLPVVCTLSFDTNGSTMMGISPSEFVRVCREATVPPHGFGANCGVGPAECVAGVRAMYEAADAADVIVAKANCGVPEFIDGAVRYDGTPELMARYARLAADSGARIIGGCCGTTMQHLAAMRQAIDDYAPGDPPGLERIESELGALSFGARGERPRERQRERRPRRKHGGRE